jgi:hypothetical protein
MASIVKYDETSEKHDEQGMGAEEPLKGMGAEEPLKGMGAEEPLKGKDKIDEIIVLFTPENILKLLEKLKYFQITVIDRINEILTVFDIIFTLIENKQSIDKELENLKTKFNISCNLKDILKRRDKKQYGNYQKYIKRLHVRTSKNSIIIEKILKKLQLIQAINTGRIINNKQNTNKILLETKEELISLMRELNEFINFVKTNSILNMESIEYIIEPKQNPIQHPKEKKFEGESLTEYSGLFELHNRSRRSKCCVPGIGLDYMINQLLLSDNLRYTNGDLFSLCYYKTCGKDINLSIIAEHVLNPDDKTRLEQLILLKKCQIINKNYSFNPFEKCNNGDCPNHKGYINPLTLEQIKNSTVLYNPPIITCGLCSNYWCSKCKDNHTGPICGTKKFTFPEICKKVIIEELSKIISSDAIIALLSKQLPDMIDDIEALTSKLNSFLDEYIASKNLYEQEIIDNRPKIMEVLSNIKIIPTGSKMCPSCACFTVKYDGCFLITCTRCPCLWCWNCGGECPDKYEHKCR